MFHYLVMWVMIVLPIPHPEVPLIPDPLEGGLGEGIRDAGKLRNRIRRLIFNVRDEFFKSK